MFSAYFINLTFSERDGKMNKLILSALTGLAFVGLTGCKTDLAPELPFAEISGVAADNIIRNGDVRIYAWDGREREILMSTRTDQFGVYSDTLQAEDQFIKVCVTGGEYTEEASGINIRLESEDRICAVTYWQSGSTQDVMVTPETNLATAYAECKAKNGSSNLQNIVSDANTRIGTLFGYNILTTMPADITSDNLQFTGLNDSIRSGLWHAAFSRLALNAAMANGLSSHTQLISSIKLHQLLYKDIADDCVLDGYALADNGRVRIPLSLGSYPLNEDVYRAGLARELIEFIESPRNKTAVKTSDVLSYAAAYSLSTDSLFPNDNPPVPLDNKGPEIVWTVADETYIAGFYPVQFRVSDFSGVTSVQFSVNGEQSTFLDTENPSTEINTSRYQDGPITVVIRATDKLNNESTLTKTLNVVNSSPVVNMTSKSLVNAADYLWNGTISDFPQGIVSATLNDKAATISDGIITAPAVLNQGVNALSLSVLDGAGQSHSYQWSVDMDRIPPKVEYRMGQWLTTLKNTATDEAFESFMKPIFGSNEAVYVTSSRFSLRGLAVTENALSLARWPTLRLEIGDFPAGTNTYSSDTSELKIKMHYLDSNSGVVHFSRTLPSTQTGIVLIPLSSEFLGEDWWQKPGSNIISVEVSDEAGNIEQLDWRLPIAVSNPRINWPVANGSYLSGDQVLSINGTDLVGIDHVSVSLNGGVPTNLLLNDLDYNLAASSLTDGLHYVVVNIVSDGAVVSSKMYEFIVDNTPPSLVVNSPALVKNAAYRLEGVASDSGSGLASVTSNGSPLSLGSFERVYTLSGGKNDFLISAVDAAGNTTTLDHRVIFDNYPPVFGSATSTDTRTLVRYGHTHAPITSWLSFSENNDPFYIDEAIVTLNGLDLTSPLTKNTLLNKNYPHFGVSISDTNDPSGDLVPHSELSLYMTVRFGSETIVDMQKLNPLVPGGGYLVPITTELFTERLREVAPTTIITVIFTAEDKAGNTTIQQHRFRAFVLPPDDEPAVITTQLSDSQWTKNNTPFQVSVSDNVGISTVDLFLGNNQTPFKSWNAGGVKNYTASNTFSDEGKVSATYKVTDLAGNVSSLTRNIFIDKTAPTVSFQQINTVASNLYVPLSISDNFPDSILETRATLGNRTRTFPGASSMLFFSNSDLPTTEGSHSLSVVVTDKAGNSRSFSRQINFQHIPSVLSMTPGPGIQGMSYTVTTNNPTDILTIENNTTKYIVVSGGACNPAMPITKTNNNTFSFNPTRPSSCGAGYWSGSFRLVDQFGVRAGVVNFTLSGDMVTGMGMVSYSQ